MSSPRKAAKGGKKVASHPTYSAMIKQAVANLKERNGSSKAAILKYILTHYNVGNNVVQVNAHLRMALNRGVKSGFLKQVKGHGASGSFRLGEGVAKKKPAAAKKRKASPKKKPAAATATGTKRKASPKKKSPKKTKKAAGPKKPKSPKKKASPKKPKSPKKAVTKKTKSPKKKVTKKASPKKK